MTTVSRKIALAAGAGLIALGIGAGVMASAQNTSQDPGSFNHQQRGRPGGPGGPMGRGGMFGPGLDGPLGLLRMLGPRLNLTDAQRDQLKSIAAAHKTEWQALADRARTSHEALNDAIMADKLDDATIRAKASELAAVEADIAVASAHARAEAWQILTPEQQEQAKQFQAEMKNRIKERRGALRRRIEEFFGH